MGVPTWLLIDYDWAATKQAAPFVPHCSDIVILPRLKWIEDSKDTGKDNHAWYRFDIRHKGGPVRQNNRGGEAIAAQRCEECHRAYRSQRSSSRFSSETVPAARPSQESWRDIGVTKQASRSCG